MQRLASRLIQVIRCCANVTSCAAPCHALQDEALIRPDDPRRRVMRQDLILQRERDASDKKRISRAKGESKAEQNIIS